MAWSIRQYGSFHLVSSMAGHLKNVSVQCSQYRDAAGRTNTRRHLRNREKVGEQETRVLPELTEQIHIYLFHICIPGHPDIVKILPKIQESCPHWKWYTKNS